MSHTSLTPLDIDKSESKKSPTFYETGTVYDGLRFFLYTLYSVYQKKATQQKCL